MPPENRNAALRGTTDVNRPPNIAIGPTAEILRRLELSITRRLDGMLQGDYRGLVPGHGSELGETRSYQPGDDVRRIDWNVTARMPETFVRETIADRELETWICADLSASLGFGTAECEKRDLALAVIAAVGFLTQRTGNRIGGMLLEANDTTTIPARGGRTNLQAFLHRVAVTARRAERGEPDLGLGLRRMHSVMRRRGLAVVVSDFIGADTWEHPLRALGAKHEVLCVEIVDPRELALPNIGLVMLEDPESGQVLEVQTADPKVRAHFASAAAEQRAAIGRSIRSAGADHLVMHTDQDWLLDLVRFVTWRRERMESLTRSHA
ncbi:MAG: DUF58 domain-containing protein [Actinobacteria bacterium]|nr:DUF58 domain-containing protein [Actinomycetota bacterium]